MDNSYFLMVPELANLEVTRFQVCIWEFRNDSSLIEFGCEIDARKLPSTDTTITLSLYIPWLSENIKIEDFYKKLSSAANSKFIFNDYVTNTQSLDLGPSITGVIHHFVSRDPLCILPVDYKTIENKVLQIEVSLDNYKRLCPNNEVNIYFRICLSPIKETLSVRKGGVSKSTVIYDIRINEKRNLPTPMPQCISKMKTCDIDTCFCFIIHPNDYDIIFIDNQSLKTVRMLEYNSFKEYLGDKRLKSNELNVDFHKKSLSESYSFFSVYSKERIGPSQYVLALLLNLFCGTLLFVPSYRSSIKKSVYEIQFWEYLPVELYAVLLLQAMAIVYFISPKIKSLLQNAK